MEECSKILNELLPPVIVEHIIDKYSVWCVSMNLSKLQEILNLNIFSQRRII
jgi:hypothetical protein